MQDGPKVKWGVVEIKAVPSVSATGSATNGHTGRSVTCDAEYGEVRNWASLPKERLAQHSLAGRFRAAVLEARCAESPVLVCYRGVLFSEARVPRSEDMGPPEERSPCPENRYNCENEKVLYLCTSESAIAREKRPEQGQNLYVQRYRLPLDQLRIADFTAADLDKFVNAVFEIAESCKVGSRGPASYAFSQFAGAVVAEAFDGMMVPGVRGDRSLHYANVVVFHPHPKWAEWLDREAAPSVCPLPTGGHGSLHRE